MQTMTVSQFKSHFSEVLDLVQNGEDIVISYGKKKKKIAVLVPFANYDGKPQRIVGLLAGKHHSPLPITSKSLTTNSSPYELPARYPCLAMALFDPDRLSKKAADCIRNPRMQHKDPFDRLFIWQSLSRKLSLISQDRAFADYKKLGLKVIW